MKIIVKLLHHAFDLTYVPASALNNGELRLRLNGLPSNTIGQLRLMFDNLSLA